jgi:TRAP-type uncharacterized transport system substrate-binding protein
VIAKLLRSLRKPEWRLGLGALLLTLVAAVAAMGYWYFAMPTRYTVAVGPRGGVEERLIGAFSDALRENNKDIRLTLVPFDDVRQSAEALQRKKADLAVVRPDVYLPDNGLTVSILREEAVLILAPTANKIKEMADLAKKRLGVVTHHEADLPVLTTILSHYDLAPPNVTLVPLGPDEVESAFTAKTIDALAFVAAPVGQEAARLVQSILKVANRNVTVVPVKEVEALALKTPALSSMTIPSGSLSGRPELPDDEIKTVGVSYRLMARPGLDRSPVSKVTQYLFQMRSRIARETASVNLMKAPDNDTITSAALPNHPGAVDYFNREQETFMDRYGDWIWLLLFAGGGVSSAMAWIAQFFARKRRELVDEVLDRLTCILSEARDAASVADLDALTVEIDGLVTHAIRYARYRTTNTRALGALILAIDSARAAVADRRRSILDPKGPAEDEPPDSTLKMATVARLAAE